MIGNLPMGCDKAQRHGTLIALPTSRSLSHLDPGAARMQARRNTARQASTITHPLGGWELPDFLQRGPCPTPFKAEAAQVALLNVSHFNGNKRIIKSAAHGFDHGRHAIQKGPLQHHDRANTRQMLAQAKKEDGINRSREEDEGDCMLRAADRYRGKKC